jgi:hypothetical protein
VKGEQPASPLHQNIQVKEAVTRLPLLEAGRLCFHVLGSCLDQVEALGTGSGIQPLRILAKELTRGEPITFQGQQFHRKEALNSRLFLMGPGILSLAATTVMPGWAATSRC